MPYQILTYTNPYEIDQAPFWNEIKDLPHFCVARTLVNGLVDVMQDSIGNLICPLDDLLKQEGIYQEWHGNIALRIAQNNYLTQLFNKTKAKSTDPRKEEFFGALEKNKGQFLDALRLFIELGISASVLQEDLALKEQKAFIRVLKRIEEDQVPVFKFPESPTLAKLKNAIVNLAFKEIGAYEDQMKGSGQPVDPDRKAWLERKHQAAQEWPMTGIVVHGVHQFSPAQIRLLTDLAKLQNFTVYFLFNYQPKFSVIYESWKTIYENFDAPERSDGKECALIPPEHQNESSALATAIGLLCEGNYSPANPAMRSSYEKYKSCSYLRFANLTEYARYVSSKVADAKQKYYADPKNAGRPLKRSSREILRLLDEQVYTANRDVHDLLGMYFPEYSKDRHFLSYPIGQFFAGLYRLWDWEAGSIKFELSTIRECISSGLLDSANAKLLLRISYDLEIILSRIETYKGTPKSFVEQMAQYLKLYDEVTNSVANTMAADARQLSIYDNETITRDEILLFVNAINYLNQCGIDLFGQRKEDYIAFGEHFQHLEDFIKQKKTDLITEAEEKLINDLLGRFDYVTSSIDKDAGGTFDDLRQGLYFYLKQKQDDDHVDWIVKNFEQIDGDILHSRKQHNIHLHRVENGEPTHIQKIYHFAAVSDDDMNLSIDKLLPWPLTEYFIRKAYSPIDLPFRVYYSALSERSNFLRYALFYGLYFNRCDVQLSYVEQVRNDTNDPFTLFTMLGIEPKDYDSSENSELPVNNANNTVSFTDRLKPTAYDLMSMMLCPHRYLMESVIEVKPIANNDFLYQKVYENTLVAWAWRKCGNQPEQVVYDEAQSAVRGASDQLKRYFFFWEEIQISDICRRATNYFRFHVVRKQSERGIFPLYKGKERHINIRNRYGWGSIYIDISEREPINPYSSFEAAAKPKWPQKIYPLHDFKEKAPIKPEHIRDMREYLSTSLAQTAQSDKKKSVVSDWCVYCPYRDTCLDSFLLTD